MFLTVTDPDIFNALIFCRNFIIVDYNGGGGTPHSPNYPSLTRVLRVDTSCTLVSLTKMCVMLK